MKASLFFLWNAQISKEMKLAGNMLQHLKDSAQDLKKRKEIYNPLIIKVNEKKKRFGLLAPDTAKVKKLLLEFIGYILVLNIKSFLFLL